MEIRELQTTSYREGWSCEVGVELQDNMRAHSISAAFEGGKDDGKLYANNLLERILHRDNMNAAYKRVKSNKGSHGVDGMKANELLPYLKQHGKALIASILDGTYRPKPVRRVEIEKPEGGIRLLGIPTVVDRMVQQAVAKVLTPIFEKTFSDNSYGFRPGRNAKQAVTKVREYMEQGY
jgi:RNA-directed DNA polymerase